MKITELKNGMVLKCSRDNSKAVIVTIGPEKVRLYYPSVKCSHWHTKQYVLDNYSLWYNCKNIIQGI